MWLGMKTKLTDKLSILQVNDHFRDWNMLDDERSALAEAQANFKE